MRKIFETLLFAVFTITLMSSGISGVNEGILSSTRETVIDSLHLSNLIKVDHFGLKIIPPSSGVQFYKDGILFLSLSKNERKMASTQISFGIAEAFYSTINDSVTGEHKIFSSAFPFSYPCDGVTFSRNYQTVFYSRLSETDKKEKIFVTEISPDNNKKQEDKQLEFCKENADYSHPALSADENTLVFASDKIGSIGGMDLYVSHRKGEGWSDPVNLGKSINTAGNEFYPFLDSDNNLYFSSDKLSGHGGYDVFTCKFNGSGWDKPVDLSLPVNSAEDDIAFTMNKNDGKTAFFTRRSANGSLQLFSVRMKSDVSDNNLVAAFNGTQTPKANLTALRVVPRVKTGLIKPSKSRSKKLVKKNITEKPPEIKAQQKQEKLPLTTTEKKPPDKTTEVSVNKENLPAKAAEPPGNTGNAKVVIIQPTLPTPPDQADIVFFRVQIMVSAKPKKEKQVMVNGTSYDLYEFYYMNAYRYSIGAFKTLQPAIELQNICRKSGYPQAFVGAFKNNTRSMDLKTFK